MANPRDMTVSPQSARLTPAAPARSSLLGLVRWGLSQWAIAFTLSSVCVVTGHLMIKAGLNHAPTQQLSAGLALQALRLLLLPDVLAGLLIYLIGSACWMIAVSQKDISFLYPLSSVNYVLVVAASALWLSETITSRRAEGIALIVAGMVLLNKPRREVTDARIRDGLGECRIERVGAGVSEARHEPNQPA